MRLAAALLAASLVALLTGCATTPPAPEAPPPADGDTGGIVLQVDVSALIGASIAAERIFFVRLDGEAAPDPRPLLVSNFRRDGRVYLLAVPPGRYAAVAALRNETTFGTTDSRFAYFPQALIDRTETTVLAGTLASAGRHAVGLTMPGVCPDSADAAQLRHAEMLAPGVPKCGFLKIVLHDIATRPMMFANGVAVPMGNSVYHHRALPREGAPAAAGDDLLEQARHDLQGSGWTVPAR